MTQPTNPQPVPPPPRPVAGKIPTSPGHRPVVKPTVGKAGVGGPTHARRVDPRHLTPEQQKRKQELDRRKMIAAKSRAEQTFNQGLATLLDLIAPAALVVQPAHIKLNNRFVRTIFVYNYPRYVQTNWLSEVINYDVEFDLSLFIYPQESAQIMANLRRRTTQLQSTETIEQERGLIRDPELETAIGDIEELRDVLQRGESKLFQFSVYMSIYADTEEALNEIVKHFESMLGGMLIYTKQALLQMEQGFTSTSPLMLDELQIVRNLDTASLSTAFPFTSSSLTSNEGVLYGINRHNNSLVLFDRFKLENANAVVFAKAGAGKSYTIKLEALRSLMLGVDVIVIDPENEYERLTEAVGGTFVKLSINSDTHINPFDLPASTGVNLGEDGLRSTVTMLHGLVSLMVGGLSAEEDALLDRALYETYALKDISTDPATQKNTPPLLTDLQSVLMNMTGAESLANRLGKYTEGSFSGLFTQPTNFDLGRGLIVFSVRDLEDQLRPVGMYLILNYIWNRVRFDQRKRLLIIDEAWFMLQHEDSAKFLFSIAKRARKYYLGLTVISQDVEDFLNSEFGRSVITNSSLQMLLKQSPAAVDGLAEVFNLTDGEKMWLLEADIGEGLFFAGQNHVAIKVVASYNEDKIITTNPEELLDMKELTNESNLEANASVAEGAFSEVPAQLSEPTADSPTTPTSEAPLPPESPSTDAPASPTPPSA